MPTAFTVEGVAAPNEQIGPVVFPGPTIMVRQTLDIGVSSSVVEIVSLRTPQYGIPLAQRVAFMHQLLPSGGDARHVGLFSSMPTRAGVGGTECSGSGYARVTHNLWRDVIVGGFVARRANSGEILFAALTGDLVAVGWGVWNDDDELQTFGLLRNEDGSARIWEMGVGDQPRFGDGTLQAGIQ